MTVEEWLGKNNKIGIDIWNKKYRYKEETFDEWVDRVSIGDEAIKCLIYNKKFLPGGRIMSNVGTDDDKTSMMNCYSSGFVEDNYDDIMQTAVNIGKTFKAQGGQGLSLSKIRPKGSPIGGRYVSDGIIPFMKIYNEVTDGTSQGGSRKGALLMSLDGWHKEALDFITIKSKLGVVEKANLSLELDDDFMNSVVITMCGDVQKPAKIKRNYSGHDVEWEVDPYKVLKAAADNCYDWGEPGCIFTDRFRNYNIMEYVPDYQIETCNPCGKQLAPSKKSRKIGEA